MCRWIYNKQIGLVKFGDASSDKRNNIFEFDLCNWYCNRPKLDLAVDLTEQLFGVLPMGYLCSQLRSGSRLKLSMNILLTYGTQIGKS